MIKREKEKGCGFFLERPSAAPRSSLKIEICCGFEGS